MKSFFTLFILFFALNCSAQNKECSLWIGSATDSIDVIKKTAEKYLKTELAQSGNPEVKTMFELKDKEELNLVKIWMKGKKSASGGGVATTYNISSVRITGLADNIESFFKSLKEQFANCTTESTNTTLVFGTNKISIEKFGGDMSKKNIPLSTMTLTSK